MKQIQNDPTTDRENLSDVGHNMERTFYQPYDRYYNYRLPLDLCTIIYGKHYPDGNLL